jgi:hypothetical protein
LILGHSCVFDAATAKLVAVDRELLGVPAAVKREAYGEYGRSKEKGKCCEVDHLIPLELGGSNRLKNLWPEPYDIEWNARVKDRLENHLHAMVCSGEIDLPKAQAAIARNWIAAYKQYILARRRMKVRLIVAIESANCATGLHSSHGCKSEAETCHRWPCGQCGSPRRRRLASRLR